MTKLDTTDRAAMRLFAKLWRDCTPDERAEVQAEIDAVESDDDWDE